MNSGTLTRHVKNSVRVNLSDTSALYGSKSVSVLRSDIVSYVMKSNASNNLLITELNELSTTATSKTMDTEYSYVKLIYCKMYVKIDEVTDSIILNIGATFSVNRKFL